MKCPECGAELSDDAKFCSNCGHKIEIIQSENSGEWHEYSPVVSDAPAEKSQKKDENIKASAVKVKEKASARWKKLSGFGKTAAIALVVFVLLFIIALIAGKTAAAIIAAVQIALAVVAILMHKGTIKIEQKEHWLKWLILAIAVLLGILNVISYSWNSEKKEKPKNNSSSVYTETTRNQETTTAVPQKSAPFGAAECMGQNYSTIQSAFKSAGFKNISIEKIEDLKLADSNKVNTVDSISVAGKTNFEIDQKFDPNDEVIIRYHAFAKCNVTISIDFIANLIFSKYDVQFLLDGKDQKNLTHGEDQEIRLSVDPGEHSLTFKSAESSDVKGEVTLNVDCDLEVGYKIYCHSDDISIETLYVDRQTELEDDEVKLNVAASEYRHKNYNDVTTQLKALGFTNIKYDILYDIVFGWTDNGEVERVSIAGKTDFNRGDVFASNTEVVITYHMPEEDDPSKPIEETTKQKTQETTKQNKTAETTTLKKEEKTKEKPVYFSTNTLENARHGNTGVFAYKSRGLSYDIYWIIDFDDEYVYYFIDNDTFCDRLKIDSGDLNDVLIITYHDGNDVWSEGLHFKWKNQPDHLILQDSDGFEWDYYATDLKEALAIKDQKTLHDF